MAWCRLRLALWAGLFSLSCGNVYPPFPVPTVDYTKLVSEDPASASEALHALVSLGVLAVTGRPGYAEERTQALSALPTTCHLPGDGSRLTATMADGSRRSSVAAWTKQGQAHDVEGGVDTTCNALLAPLRNHVDATANQLFQALDQARSWLPGHEAGSPALMESAQQGKDYSSFTDLFNLGDHLEHFHVYEPASSPSEGRPALDMHTDSGLLIAMTPGLLLPLSSATDASRTPRSQASTPSGLLVQLPHGSVVEAQFPDDAVVFMVGEGAAQWLQVQAHGDASHLPALRAVPHALMLPWQRQSDSSSSTSLVPQARAWHGRMFFPPSDSLVGTSDTTFASVREMQMRTVGHGGSLGCGLGHIAQDGWEAMARAMETGHAQLRRLGVAGVDSSVEACTADDGSDGIVCWMQCQSVSSLPCGQNAQCVDTVSGKIVDGNDMCPEDDKSKCKPECVADTPSNSSDSNGFCFGTGTDMYMDGFTSMLDSGSSACLNLLFKSWTLDTKTKFAGGCIGTFFLAMLTELLTFIRRKTLAKLRGTRHVAVVMSCMHAVQVAVGYFVMLVAMTYQVELFVTIICGLAVGHYWFNSSVPPPESTDPCCVGRDIVSPSSDYASLKADESLLLSGPSVKLRVGGMTCGNCTSTVQKALQALPGVHLVLVDLATNSAVVHYEPGFLIDGGELVEAVKSCGYDAVVDQ